MHEHELSSSLNDLLRSFRPEAPVECREGPERLYSRHERTVINPYTPLSKLTVPSSIRKLGLDKKLEHCPDARVASITENGEGPRHVASDARFPEKTIGLRI